MFELISQEPEAFGDSLGFFETEELCIMAALDRQLEIFCIEYWYKINYEMVSYGINKIKAIDLQ